MGWHSVCDDAVRSQSYFLNKNKTLYEIYIENGWNPWLAFQTQNETEANDYFRKAQGNYVYLRVLDDKGSILKFVCEKR